MKTEYKLRMVILYPTLISKYITYFPKERQIPLLFSFSFFLSFLFSAYRSCFYLSLQIISPPNNPSLISSQSFCRTSRLTAFQSSSFLAIAEVYKTEGNEAYLKEDYYNAVYFYTEGIKVSCKDEDVRAKLYSNRAYANLRLGEARFL